MDTGGLTATPMGDATAISRIKIEDVSIAHRLRRAIYDGTNQGSEFKSTKGGRIHYDAVPNWPIVHKFPSDDISYQTSKQEAEALPDFCVLPDY